MPKVLDTPKLLTLIDAARADGARAPTGLVLDPAGKHVLSGTMLHNDVDVRCLVFAKTPGVAAPCEFVLDVDLAAYNAIPDYVEGA